MDIVIKAKRLYELDVNVINSVMNRNIEEFKKALIEFYKLKKEIKKILIKFPFLEVQDELAKKVLQKINKNEAFESDYAIALFSKKEVDEYLNDQLDIDELFDDDELYQIESDNFYSWFSGRDYIRCMYMLGSLILGKSIPPDLNKLVDEVRNCFAFQQYNAVYSLCRTMLELSIRDIGLRKELIQLIPDLNNNFHFYKQYPPHKLINCVSKGELNKRIHDLYDDLSCLIHGFKTVDYDVAIRVYKKTLEVISKLYET